MHVTTQMILDQLLATDDYVSGEQMCHLLNISRVAVSKHVSRLRSLGYDIESTPRLGHRLKSRPDTPFTHQVRPLLATHALGRSYTYLEATDSASRFLMAEMRSDTPHGSVVVAETQTAGRGRLNHQWFSPPGNLHVAVMLRPQIIPQRVAELSLVVGAAIRTALAKRWSEAEFLIKWPNDILVGGKKIVGVLCENSSEIDRVYGVVVGFGVNVNHPLAAYPPELRSTVTTLHEISGGKVNRSELLADLLLEIEISYQRWLEHGLADFLPDLQTHSALMGLPVAVTWLGREVTGTAVGYGPDGALILRTESGELNVPFGEVHIQRQAPEARVEGE